MGNELKDIANKLCPYDSLSDGWEILSADKMAGGHWKLEIQPHLVETKAEAEPQEATDDNN